MTELDALVLGVVQGLTEFLPVSSSGHLAVGAHFLGYEEPNTAFDIALHMGTLVAVLLFFWRNLWEILSSPLRIRGIVAEEGWRGLWMDPGLRGGILLVAGSIPTAVIGLALGPRLEARGGSLTFVATMFLLNGLILLGSRYVVLPWFTRKPVNKGLRGVRLVDALVMGVVQGLAITRGISRSGSTISMGIMVGMDREAAGRFSFLLSIPAILGAQILSMAGGLEQSGLSVAPGVMVLGVGAAFASGMGALWLLMTVVRRGKLYRFGWYTLALGVILLLWIYHGDTVTGGLEAIRHGSPEF